MFTLEELRSLLNAQPFVPFRLHMSDGGSVDIHSRELVFPGRRYAVIGLLDPSTSDTAFDRFMIVGYLHVTRVEVLSSGPPPLAPPSGPSEAPSPALT
jgi:hypothetical protein